MSVLLVRPLIIHNNLRENESAYDRYMIRPRVLRDLSKLDTSTSIVGCKVKFPFGFSPIHADTGTPRRRRGDIQGLR